MGPVFHLRRPQHICGGRHARLGSLLCRADGLDFPVAFNLSLGEKRSGGHFQADTGFAQRIGRAQGEVTRHQQVLQVQIF